MTRYKPHEFNENTHRLVRPYPMQAVIVATSRDETEPESYLLKPELRDTLEIIRKKRPTWAFVDAYSTTVRLVTTRDIDVYDGDEYLGRIWTDLKSWRDTTTIICWGNPRVNAAMQRVSHGSSKHAARAAKGVLEMFYSKTPREQTADTLRIVREAMRNSNYAASREFRKREQALDGALKVIARTRWSELKAAFPELETHEGWREAETAMRDMDRFVNKPDDSGVTVKLYSDGGCLVSLDSVKDEAGGTILVRYKPGELPEKYTASLGLLKLVQDGTTIPGVGCRASATDFYLVAAEE